MERSDQANRYVSLIRVDSNEIVAPKLSFIGVLSSNERGPGL